MLKRDYVIILLIIFIGIGLDYMSFQRNAIAEQRDTISQLSGRITLLSREVSEQSAKTSEAIIGLNSFDVIVREYLKAERRLFLKILYYSETFKKLSQEMLNS